MLRRIAALSLLAAGCGEPADAPVDARPPVDSPPPPGFPETLMLSASQATITLPFAIDATGNGASPFGDVAMVRDVGTLGLAGAALPAFVYMTTPFGEFTLFQGFAVGAERWDVFWLYCRGSQLAFIFDEGIAGPPLFFRPAAGVCTPSFDEISATVALPAAAVPAPVPFRGYQVSGPEIAVAADGTGTVTVEDRALPLAVFGDVDCSDCGGLGWFELHTIVWDDERQRAIFVIVYLLNSDTGSVQLAYARSLPDLGDPIGTATIPATWNARAAARRTGSAGPRFGVPPPALRDALRDDATRVNPPALPE